MLVVLTGNEVRAVLARLEGRPWLMASLLYGAGLRLIECARVRVKDVDFAYAQMTVRDGKGRRTGNDAPKLRGGRGVVSPLDRA